jgi:plasmid maintenance system antidote protein VapI
MKNLQQETLKKILEAEQLSISALANKIEVNRTYLSQLFNHKKPLSTENWNKLTEAYPEHVAEFFKANDKHVNDKNVILDDSSKKHANKPVSIKKIKIAVKPKNIKVEAKPEEKFENKEKIVDVQGPEQIEQKTFKVKEENRHRNLTCIESSYHMKVPYKDLLRARPLCPITGFPMLMKEEIKKYKSMDEAQRKEYVKSITSTINLLKR